MEIADPYFGLAPTARPFRNKFTADAAMKLGRKAFVEGEVGQAACIDLGLHAEHLSGKPWGYLGIGEDSLGCFKVAGGPIRASWPSNIA